MFGSQAQETAIDGRDDSAPPAALPVGQLESRILELAGNLAATECQFLLLIEEFDRRRGWAVWGVRSCAHWLNWRCGLDLGAARERLRVARRLVELPRVTAAFARGELSYAKVRALTRVATPTTEETLLMWAQYGTASHLERIVRGFRRAKAAEEAAQAVASHNRRYLKYFHDEDGSLVIRARIPAEQGALVLAALQSAVEGLAQEEPPRPVPRPTARVVARPFVYTDVSAQTWGSKIAADLYGVSEETGVSSASPSADLVQWPTPAQSAEGAKQVGVCQSPDSAQDVSAETFLDPLEPEDPVAARRADGLIAVAEAFLAASPRSLAGAERHHIVVHVDASTLRDPSLGERCKLEEGPALSAETVMRLSCDASIVPVLHSSDGSVLDVGRQSRSVPAALRRALQTRDGGCRFPGCGASRYVDAHHVSHWARGGSTSLSNLLQLCRHHHHRLVHEGGFSVRAEAAGGFSFSRPDGRPVPDAPQIRGKTSTLLEANRQAGLEIDATTCSSRWDGQACDYDMAVGFLCLDADRALASAPAVRMD
ncbi:MAG: DUF222 domain-containing protein [Actinomycetota bacterium]